MFFGTAFFVELPAFVGQPPLFIGAASLFRFARQALLLQLQQAAPLVGNAGKPLCFLVDALSFFGKTAFFCKAALLRFALACQSKPLLLFGLLGEPPRCFRLFFVALDWRFARNGFDGRLDRLRHLGNAGCRRGRRHLECLGPRFRQREDVPLTSHARFRRSFGVRTQFHLGRAGPRCRALGARLGRLGVRYDSRGRRRGRRWKELHYDIARAAPLAPGQRDAGQAQPERAEVEREQQSVQGRRQAERPEEAAPAMPGLSVVPAARVRRAWRGATPP